jgi:hypothetical protein
MTDELGVQPFCHRDHQTGAQHYQRGSVRGPYRPVSAKPYTIGTTRSKPQEGQSRR